MVWNFETHSLTIRLAMLHVDNIDERYRRFFFSSQLLVLDFFPLSLQFFIESTKRIIYKDDWIQKCSGIATFSNNRLHMDKIDRRYYRFFFSRFLSISFHCFYNFSSSPTNQWTREESGILNCNWSFYNPSGYVAREQNRYRRSSFRSRSFVLDLTL